MSEEVAEAVYGRRQFDTAVINDGIVKSIARMFTSYCFVVSVSAPYFTIKLFLVIVRSSWPINCSFEAHIYSIEPDKVLLESKL